MKEAESPRKLLGLPETPPPGAEPISDKEAKRISEAIGQPLPGTEIVAKPTVALETMQPQVLVMDRMSGALEVAGVTQKKIAEVLHDALEAKKYVNIGVKAYLEVDDHGIRLAAVKEIKSLVAVEQAPPVEETSTEEVMELFDSLSPEDMSKIRKKVTHKRKIVQSVPPSVSPMIIDEET